MESTSSRGNRAAPVLDHSDAADFGPHFSNIQIGNSNIQGIHIDAENLIAAIKGSNASAQRKADAKSLLRQLIENSLVAKVIGRLVGAS